MDRTGRERGLVASILDRLIDREPQAPAEPPARRVYDAARLQEAVKRDLEWLLNTRRTAEGLPPKSEAARSVLAYGLPDFAAAGLNSPADRERLRLAIEEAIARFEPRLRAVRVAPEEPRPFDRALRFRIDALLLAEPEPLPVAFDSVLELASRSFEVRGAAGDDD